MADVASADPQIQEITVIELRQFPMNVPAVAPPPE
jgi:hypothetical protein